MINNSELSSFQSESFQANLEHILTRQLSPETIDTYASDALDALVGLTERVTSSYNRQPTIEATSSSEAEDSAFNYFGLGELEKSLDHVADLAESIHLIDEVIKDAIVTSKVIIPTDHREVNIQPGDGSFNKKNTYNRLKTTFFILQQDFGIDIRNRLNTGGTESIMRGSSYNLIDVPELERVILVCDEEGNVTYVFDSVKLAENGKDSSQLMDLSKTELDNLIKMNPGIGGRIVYSKHFIGNIKNAIGEEIVSDEPEGNIDNQTTYLQSVEKALEGYLSVKGMVKMFGTGHSTIINAISNLDGEIGIVINAKFGARTASAYSPVQQEIIREYLEDKGLFSENAPDGYLNANNIARNYNISTSGVTAAIDVLGNTLGDVIKCRFGSVVTDAYSPAQQEIIRRYLEDQGALTEKPPEGYLSVSGMMTKLNVSNDSIKKAITDLGEKLGQPVKAKFGNIVTNAYSPDQQEMIRQYLGSRGIFSEVAPEGYSSVPGMVRDFGISHGTISGAITILRQQLGEPIKSKFGVRPADAYSPDQQKVIREYLDSRGLFAEKVPDGYMSVKAMIGKFNAAQATIFAAIESLGEVLGHPIKAKFGRGVAADAYSPDQQEMIRTKIEADRAGSAKVFYS